MVAKGGKPRSLAEAMREAGYSESYARNPQKIKHTKFWREYLQEFISDEKIVSVHTKLLEAQKLSTMDFPVLLTDEDLQSIFVSGGRQILTVERGENRVKVTFTEPDFSTRATAIDMAYKVRGLYQK
ncbi:MAG: hypothetical protein AAB381_02285 [Patescibacteria group bacterium]